MMEFIGMFVVAFLASVGLIWLAHTLIVSFSSDKDRGIYILISADEHCTDLEFRIVEAQTQLKRLGGRSIKKIIILDNGMSKEMREIARKKEVSDSAIIIKTCDELQNLV